MAVLVAQWMKPSDEVAAALLHSCCKEAPAVNRGFFISTGFAGIS